jgi:hypothetical protein
MTACDELPDASKAPPRPGHEPLKASGFGWAQRPRAFIESVVFATAASESGLMSDESDADGDGDGDGEPARDLDSAAEPWDRTQVPLWWRLRRNR